ncbi:DtxR family transcriptional regulator, Mn-dependent transcriptional regulator [Enterococcus sp. DIV2402]|uniref:DtxR family transcriptional regulator, Mn-dependent transcriptional regulator n=1 Tax=Candidatus Enterococcus lowellii TaxID=2230877 RepID=A0ABZ2SU68_9ENTE|nr:metal-dependent transcriptional regulator [Enterococcus sp. DIV2402]MBO0463787.1 metal-dependent transcriptional regulator [Enterococcus sp. DIV2402]
MNSLSAEKEEYLKLIYYYNGQIELVGNNKIAKHLSLSNSSVTEMFQKLANDKLVKYFPYKGVQLTKYGLKKVEQLQRKQRLLRIFFEHHLECTEEEIMDLLNHLEHIDNQLFFNKLELFLNLT